MEFLVRLTSTLPPDTPQDVRERLRDDERARAQELREALSSLPMFPWQDIVVEALATHPQERT